MIVVSHSPAGSAGKDRAPDQSGRAWTAADVRRRVWKDNRRPGLPPVSCFWGRPRRLLLEEGLVPRVHGRHVHALVAVRRAGVGHLDPASVVRPVLDGLGPGRRPNTKKT